MVVLLAKLSEAVRAVLVAVSIIVFVVGRFPRAIGVVVVAAIAEVVAAEAIRLVWSIDTALAKLLGKGASAPFDSLRIGSESKES